MIYGMIVFCASMIYGIWWAIHCLPETTVLEKVIVSIMILSYSMVAGLFWPVTIMLAVIILLVKNK